MVQIQLMIFQRRRWILLFSNHQGLEFVKEAQMNLDWTFMISIMAIKGIAYILDQDYQDNTFLKINTH